MTNLLNQALLDQLNGFNKPPLLPTANLDNFETKLTISAIIDQATGLFKIKKDKNGLDFITLRIATNFEDLQNFEMLAIYYTTEPEKNQSYAVNYLFKLWAQSGEIKHTTEVMRCKARASEASGATYYSLLSCKIAD